MYLSMGQRFVEPGFMPGGQVADQKGSYTSSPDESTSNRPAIDDEQLKRLGHDLRQHARRISMHTAVFLDNLAIFDAHEGWRIEGARSCSHWLSWRCSLGRGSASEHVRVARALQSLPLIRELLQKGDLSFSKTRAITRVATTDNEDELVDMAIATTAHELEWRVRQYRDARSAEAVRDEDQRERWQHNQRSLTHYWREDGCLQVYARLTPEQGVLFLKSLGLAEESVGSDSPDRSDYSPSESDTEHDHGSDAEGINIQQVRTPPQRRADALTAMAEGFLAGGGAGRSGDRFQVVVNVDLDTLQNTEPGEEDAGAAIGSGVRRTESAMRREGTCQLDPGGPAISPETARRLSCDSSIVAILSQQGEPLSIGRKSAIVPGSMRRALNFRDAHRCQFPGCCAELGLQAHHVQHWALGGDTALDNLVLLCHFHHRLLHEGGFSMQPNPEWQPQSEQPPRSRSDSESGRSVSRGKRQGIAACPSPEQPEAVPRFLFHDQQGRLIGSESGESSERIWDVRARGPS